MASLLQNRCSYFGQWELAFSQFFCAFQQKRKQAGAFRGDQAKNKKAKNEKKLS